MRDHIGTVRLWKSRGLNEGQQPYGFIRDDGGQDVYVNLKAVEAAGLDRLCVGDRIEFTPEPAKFDGGKLRARNIKLIEETAP